MFRTSTASKHRLCGEYASLFQGVLNEGSIEHGCREGQYAAEALREEPRIRFGAGNFRKRETLKPWKYVTWSNFSLTSVLD